MSPVTRDDRERERELKRIERRVLNPETSRDVVSVTFLKDPDPSTNHPLSP